MNEPRARRRGYALVGLSLALLLAACLGCGLFSWSAPLWLPFSGYGFAVEGCAGWGTTFRGDTQLALSWVSPYISSAPGPAFFLPHHSCAFLPWMPFLPPRGDWVWSTAG